MQFLLGGSVSLESLIPDPKSREEGKKEAEEDAYFFPTTFQHPLLFWGEKIPESLQRIEAISFQARETGGYLTHLQDLCIL